MWIICLRLCPELLSPLSCDDYEYCGTNGQRPSNVALRCFVPSTRCFFFLLCCPLCRPQVVNAQAHENMYSRVPIKESKSWELMATAVDQRRQAIPRNVIVATFDPVKCRGASHRQNWVLAPYSTFKLRNDINSGTNPSKFRRSVVIIIWLGPAEPWNMAWTVRSYCRTGSKQGQLRNRLRRQSALAQSSL